MNSAQLASALGEGWEPLPTLYPAEAKRGFCTVRFSRFGFFALFDNSIEREEVERKVPADAVRACLLKVVRRLNVTRDDLEAIMPGVTEL